MGSTTKQTAAPTTQSMQPVAPTFRMSTHVPHTQLNVGSAVAASRRASVAAVERLVEKMAITEDGGRSPSGRPDHRLSLTCESDLAASLRPLTPDLPSSPEDEQSKITSLLDSAVAFTSFLDFLFR